MLKGNIQYGVIYLFRTIAQISLTSTHLQLTPFILLCYHTTLRRLNIVNHQPPKKKQQKNDCDSQIEYQGTPDAVNEC